MDIINFYQKAKAEYTNQRFAFSFVAVPVVYGLCTLILLADLIMLLIAKQKLLIVCLVLFGVVLLAIIVLECIRPFVFKADVKKETERLKAFFDQNLIANPICDFVLPTTENLGTVNLTFMEDGIDIGNFHYSYDGFECALFTSNYKYRVNLIMLFNRTQKGDREDGDEKGVARFSLPADLNLLSVMNKYDIKIANGDVFAFIKDNPEEAARQILKYGRVQNNYDKYRVR